VTADQTVSDYCRQIETYLCRRNDGHLIRIVGPSFDLVSQWAGDGIPIKIAFQGIDRYFERYYRKGPRRRPVRIDFCDADVRDVFDEWQRAVGFGRASAAGEPGEDDGNGASRSRSLPAHLERALLRLTDARTNGRLGADADDLLDRAGRELDAARAASGGLRGAARKLALDRLESLDLELMTYARRSLPDRERVEIEQEADDQLASFRANMAVDAYARARERAITNLIRERLHLPTLAFT
jgi:hypothetical protein